jgi:hydrogenase-4 component B
VFRATEQVEMPPPSDPRAARLQVRVQDLIYDWLYAPVALGVLAAAERLNVLQFLTIRSYLSLVFFALVSLLTVLALWP